MREEHTFRFGAKEIAEAAAKQANYHGERLAFWKKEYDSSVVIVKKQSVQN